MELPNQRRKLERPEKKGTYKYFGILEADTIKQVEMLFTQPLRSGRIWHKVNF